MHTDIEKVILDKLLSHGYVGRKHTPEDNIPKGFPKHMYEEVRKALKNLVREGLVLRIQLLMEWTSHLTKSGQVKSRRY